VNGTYTFKVRVLEDANSSSFVLDPPPPSVCGTKIPRFIAGLPLVT
jgi:hypothetical protein